MVLEKTPIEEYHKLSLELGVHNGNLSEVIIKNFCLENDIPIYDMGEVYAYMDKVIVAERRERKNRRLVWFWKRLTNSEIRCLAIIRSIR